MILSTLIQTRQVYSLAKNNSQSSTNFTSDFHQITSNSSDSNIINQINYNESYTVTLRTSTIDDRIIQASIIESTHFKREEAYIVKYVDHNEQPVIDYDSNPCQSFSFPYCVLQNYDDSDHYSFSYSIFYQSDYVIYIDVDQLDVPLNYLNSTLIDSVLLSLHNNETDVFTCTTYSDRLLNGCLIARQSLIRDIITKTTITKGKLDVLDYLPLYFEEMNRELKVKSMFTKNSQSPYLNVKDKLIPSVFGCDLSENDTSFTLSVTTYRRPKMNMVFKSIDRQDLQPKQVIMIQNSDRLQWHSSLFANRKTQYYHIWCSNWNSKFIGKYHPGMLFDTTFNFIIDDDVFIEDRHGFSKLSSIIPFDNKIYGYACNFGNKDHRGYGKTDLCDNTGILIYPRVKHLKLMFQYNLLTYSSGEDLQISLINYILCGVETKQYAIHISLSQGDEYRRGKDTPQQPRPSFNNITYCIRESEYASHGFLDLYNYYVDQGFVHSWNRKKK